MKQFWQTLGAHQLQVAVHSHNVTTGERISGRQSAKMHRHHKPATTPDYEAAIAFYCLMDDVYFRTFMRDNYPAAQLMLGIILQKRDVKVTRIETQRDLKNL